MPLNFPTSPTNGQVYTDSTTGNRYIYDSGNTYWKYSATPYLASIANNQLLFDDLNLPNGSNGMTFSKSANTIYLNNVAVTQNVTATFYFGDGSRLTGIPSYAFANGTANSANAYAVTLGASSNAWANSLSTIDRAMANAAANSANAYTVTVGGSSNAWANSLSTSDRAVANAAANAANAYTATVGTAGNNYTNAVGTAGNNYTNSVGAAANNFMGTSTANTVRNNATTLISTGYTVTSFNAGANIAAYTTWTPNPANGNYQYVTISGGVTVAAPAANCAIDVLWYNGAGVSTVTFSGYQVGTPGDTYVVTNGTEFILSIRRINNLSTYTWKALQ